MMSVTNHRKGWEALQARGVVRPFLLTRVERGSCDEKGRVAKCIGNCDSFPREGCARQEHIIRSLVWVYF